MNKNEVHFIQYLSCVSLSMGYVVASSVAVKGWNSVTRLDSSADVFILLSRQRLLGV